MARLKPSVPNVPCLFFGVGGFSPEQGKQKEIMARLKPSVPSSLEFFGNVDFNCLKIDIKNATM